MLLLLFQDLVRKMLIKDPLERLTAAEVQEHVWIAVSIMDVQENMYLYQNIKNVEHLEISIF